MTQSFSKVLACRLIVTVTLQTCPATSARPSCHTHRRPGALLWARCYTPGGLRALLPARSRR